MKLKYELETHLGRREISCEDWHAWLKQFYSVRSKVILSMLDQDPTLDGLALTSSTGITLFVSKSV